LQREIDTANNALSVVENGDFAGYIGERINWELNWIFVSD
jgi:hypothetical protein